MKTGPLKSKTGIFKENIFVKRERRSIESKDKRHVLASHGDGVGIRKIAGKGEGRVCNKTADMHVDEQKVRRPVV